MTYDGVVVFPNPNSIRREAEFSPKLVNAVDEEPADARACRTA